MIESLQQSLAIFDNLRKFSEIVQKRSRALETILGKFVGNLRQMVKNVVISMSINKQNNTWLLVNMEYIFECSV